MPTGATVCILPFRVFLFSFVSSAKTQKTATALVFATTNCLPLCSPYAQDGQLFYIVRVEEQNQGLDNPSNPPCCCRSKCNSRTNADRHTPNIARREVRKRVEEEESLVTHDSIRDWLACGASTRSRGGDGRNRGCHLHRKPPEARRKAHPEAGGSPDQSDNQSARERHATSHPLITSLCTYTHTHTTGPVPSDPLFASCEFRVDC